MTKHELIKSIAARTDLSIADAMMALQSLTAAVIEQLNDGERVEINGFGAFEMRISTRKAYRNPRTGEPVYIGERQRPVFIASEEMKSAMN